MKTSREEAVLFHGEEAVVLAEVAAIKFTGDRRFTLFEWEDAPLALRKICTQNGGDEDFLIVTGNEQDLSLGEAPYWIEKIHVCGSDVDIYYLEGCTIYVTYHS